MLPTAVQTALDARGTYTFGSACSIELTQPLTMTGGSATLEGNANLVDVAASPSVTSTQLFSVTGGSLALQNLTLSGGTAQGANGTDAGGNSNGNGGDGTAAQGGAMTISAGATVDLADDTVEGNTAPGGGGGSGDHASAGTGRRAATEAPARQARAGPSTTSGT
ncbi:MAG: hypothetical protein ACYDEN_01450 [Acidimicrobiales bacterium]